MIDRKKPTEEGRKNVRIEMLETLPLWQLDIAELTGHNVEAHGREEVNRLLQEGWRLLHIYTLKYEEDGVWRERPMAILGRSKDSQKGEPIERK
jgi:FtsZ-binding cell division protein ZapB